MLLKFKTIKQRSGHIKMLKSQTSIGFLNVKLTLCFSIADLYDPRKKISGREIRSQYVLLYVKLHFIRWFIYVSTFGFVSCTQHAPKKKTTFIHNTDYIPFFFNPKHSRLPHLNPVILTFDSRRHCHNVDFFLNFELLENLCFYQISDRLTRVMICGLH